MASIDKDRVDELLKIIEARSLPDRDAIHEVFHKEAGLAPGMPILYTLENVGYLEKGRELLEDNDTWGLLTVGADTVKAVFGPAFLFLLLLTLRNRFRLA